MTGLYDRAVIMKEINCAVFHKLYKSNDIQGQAIFTKRTWKFLPSPKLTI